VKQNTQTKRGSLGNVNSQNMANNAAYKNYKQKELDEAIELDRMLEIERRN